MLRRNGTEAPGARRWGEVIPPLPTEREVTDVLAAPTPSHSGHPIFPPSPCRMLVAVEATTTLEFNVIANAEHALALAPAGTLEALRPRIPAHVPPLPDDFWAMCGL